MNDDVNAKPWVRTIEALRTSASARTGLYGFLAALVVIDVFVPKEHAFLGIDGIPGFWSLYGLISCIVISLLSKWLGHAWLMKSEDYYD